MSAFTEKTRRVGLDHQVFFGDDFVGDQPGAEIGIVGKTEKLPFRQGFGHGELDRHLPVLFGNQVGKEKCGLVQVLPGGDLAKIGARRGGLISFPV